mgnify:CR=1 FL=1
MALKTYNEFTSYQSKPWKAKKSQILQFWKNLRPNLPIQMNAVSKHHKGTRFRSDGLRITGTPEFINSIICRLKEMISLENENTRIDIEYRQVEPKLGDLEKKYVFYMHLITKEE